MQRMLDSTLKCRNGPVKVIPRESGPDVTYGLTCYNVQGYVMSTPGTTTTAVERSFLAPLGRYSSPGTPALLGITRAASRMILQTKPMTAVFILAFSVLALVKFAISQWRMIWLTTAHQPLSDTLQTATGIESESIGPNDFGKLLGLCDQLSPRLQKSTPWLREVKGYYQIVTKLEKACRSIQPALSAWASAEMKTCSRYVAVVLDQNLSLDLDQRAAVRSI